MCRRTEIVLLVVVLLLLVLPAGADEQTRLFRNPAIGERHVAFVYANDIWVVDRGGGDARRLTTFHGAETEPHFSPDGMTVAFSGQYDGNTDVYIVPVTGGEPKRLTWHPTADTVSGWTGDGNSVLFNSGRINAPRPWPRLWTISVDGGMPTQLPIPRAVDGAYSPDGKQIAYEKLNVWDGEWRNHRGGQAQPIRVLDLKSHAEQDLPWEGSNDIAPVWIDDSIFFLSDRDWAMNVWSYDTGSQELEQRTHFKEMDCKRLEGGAGRLVFENGGHLYTMDVTGGKAKKLDVTVRGDFPAARPHWEDVSTMIADFELSPTGKRAVMEARGEIFTIPGEKGDIRNLSRDSGAADRRPSWSPDGQKIAWFSDRGGEYALVLTDQFGDDRRTIELPDPTFFYTPVWSPDSQSLAYGDADRNLWIVDIESGKSKKIGTEGFAHPVRLIYPEWSPDSRWIAYAKRLPSQYAAVVIYSVEDGTSHQLTDGLSNAHSPAWDVGGKQLYFLASTDYGLNVGWLDMSSINQRVNNSIYVAVLDRESPSPLALESDDEEVVEEETESEDTDEESDDDEEADDVPEVTIDFDGIDQRVLALGVPARPYTGLSAGVEDTVFYAEAIDNQPGVTLHRYSFESREAEVVTSGIVGFDLSDDGMKLLVRRPPNAFTLFDAVGAPTPGEGALDLSAMRMKVDPAAEWKQLFLESWRFQRDYFYVDNVHGLDLEWARKAYGEWVSHVRHRADLTYVLDILGGETAVGHSFTGGGDTPDVETVPGGLLGADFDIDRGRFRIDKIYNGENWNPGLKSPLSGPGIDAAVGDYLLAVNDVELKAGDNLYRLFDRTAGSRTRLSLSKSTKMADARQVTVVPVANDGGLRTRDWVESNRRRVDKLSDGKLAYVWIPDTGGGGYTSFNRNFFAQQHKKGAIIDERYNHGGSIADYIVDLLSRDLLGYFNNPIGDRQPFTAPNAAIWGPKVMLINEMSGSGGDMLPYMFRKKEIGPLVGTRTWGGLVGIWDVPGLIDGGFITAPRGGFYDTEGNWAVENEGVPPDVHVEQTAKLVNQGHDPQLETAVEIALELLKTEGIQLLPQPEDPVRTRRPK
ncbi:MAG: PDZ domain-containing protein [Acidobacteriota bacterium]|nr:PDZ domain-containing protein [Acidobacteriota bacterium]